MKKGQIVEGIVKEVQFPNKGIVHVEGEEKTVVVKNAITGQKVRASINKMRKGKAEGRLLEVLEHSQVETESDCIHFAECGGCTYRTLPYEEQLNMKAAQVKKLLDEVCGSYEFEGIKGSPKQQGYRNKMEFSFGDAFKDGPLALGMHKRGSFYDIITVNNCRIVDEDFRKILTCVLEYFADTGATFYHKLRHEGYLRHLLVRKGQKTGEILVDLVTSSQWNSEQPEEEILASLTEKLCALSLQGKIAGVLHTVNDSLADIIQNDRTDILFGQDYFYEELLGLKFKISPFSFFQTNSLGAEVLYETARSYVGETKDRIIFDLYSGTGTIAQILAPVAKKVIGVEIVAEAVEAAKENAALNGLSNCEFKAGDVLKVLDDISDKPDIIVLDPPRDGIHPKALVKIIEYYGCDHMVYISCKPTSLARDLVTLQEYGYGVKKVCCVDMFPGTQHVETIALLQKSNRKRKPDTHVKLSLDMEDYYRIKDQEK
ncbi:MAG: 23S rRNA (uracil(1939)-C(5))-methyltransferase RlmD [Eubacteriales bacterium]|nr:23S rRNA (uracil(1939)-C(5))-methyltransferase RlmD [Eubacteriales bacterium]